MAKPLALSEKILPALAKAYYETSQEIFDFQMIQDRFDSCTKEELTGACKILASKGFVSLLWASGEIYTVSLTPEGLSHVEENSFWRKAKTGAFEFVKALLRCLPCNK